MNPFPRRTLLFWPTSLLVAFAALLIATSSGSAAPAIPPGPDRFGIQLVKYTAYDWLMVSFKENKPVCRIVVDYAGTPTLDDVYIDCGDKVTNKWVAQQPCLSPDEPQTCDGYYIYFLGSRRVEKEVAEGAQQAVQAVVSHAGRERVLSWGMRCLVRRSA